MKIRLVHVSMGLFVIVFGLSAVSCTKNVRVADPFNNARLVPPYTSYESGPTDRISVQYAVIEIARQVGLEYDWDKSFKNTSPVCQQWLRPEITGTSFPHAMELILKPVNLTYTIENRKIVLGRLLSKE